MELTQETIAAYQDWYHVVGPTLEVDGTSRELRLVKIAFAAGFAAASRKEADDMAGAAADLIPEPRPQLQQPPTGDVTLGELRQSLGPESFTIGRLTRAVVSQGCNPWTIVRILYDYYVEMCHRRPDQGWWPQQRDELLALERSWRNPEA